ncbi:MAG TPA: group III truncated hemoglobin [Caulobacteraceae bacterium]|nr:group III truncated hemoglobin [Caulobacteraceae bacterium]
MSERAAPFDRVDEETLIELVGRFYAEVRRDPQLGPVFEAAVDDWDRHLWLLVDFWSSVMLTSGRYHGRPVPAHMKLPIEPAMFDRWLALWAETTGELFTPEIAQRFQHKARNIARSLSLAMFFRPENPGAPLPV